MKHTEASARRLVCKALETVLHCSCIMIIDHNICHWTTVLSSFGARSNSSFFCFIYSFVVPAHRVKNESCCAPPNMHMLLWHSLTLRLAFHVRRDINGLLLYAVCCHCSAMLLHNIHAVTLHSAIRYIFSTRRCLFSASMKIFEYKDVVGTAPLMKS